MVFSSFKFLFAFLPLFLISYYLIEDRYKNLCIFLYSLVFYAYGCIDNIHYLFILIASLFVNYQLGLYIERNEKLKKLVLFISIIFNLGILFIFKYAKFNLVLPIGISFYTFQILSYIFDVYAGKIEAEKNFINLSTYIAMFPQLIAGPIVRYKDVKSDIKSERSYNRKDLIEGFRIFALGLASKVIIANQLSAIGLDVSSYGIETASSLTAFLDAMSYAFQIYYDFFGYSLMAIGLGRMMGITIMKNFDLPYSSVSMTEFWQRWHISLGSWFKDYVYIPLGGNRMGKIATYMNLFIVFTLSGIWHGATKNYMLWGMALGIVVLIERAFLLKFFEKFKVIGHIYILLVFILSMVIFKNEDMSLMATQFRRIFDFKTISDTNVFLEIIKNNLKAILLGIIFLTPLPLFIYKKIKKNLVLHIITICILFALSIYLIYIGFNDPFMYFRF